jgi:zinc transport system permease protein
MSDWLGLDAFMWRAAAAGIGVALLTGALGVFVVWRRMAYFGDTLAHSALLGIALGFLLGVAPQVGVLVTALVVALFLVKMRKQVQLANDTLLGILAHSALSLGLVTVAFVPGLRTDLMGYLFGDLLAVSASDLAWIWGLGALAMLLLAWIWRGLLATTVHAELAAVEGVPTQRMELFFILLITALMIIPAATARRVSHTPEQMAILASVLGSLAVLGGLWLSWELDTPAGPSVVVIAAVLFALSLLRPMRT